VSIGRSTERAPFSAGTELPGIVLEDGGQAVQYRNIGMVRLDQAEQP